MQEESVAPRGIAGRTLIKIQGWSFGKILGEIRLDNLGTIPDRTPEETPCGTPRGIASETILGIADGAFGTVFEELPEDFSDDFQNEFSKVL